MRRHAAAAGLLGALLVTGAVAPTPAGGSGLSITVSAPLVKDLITAAVPYRLALDAGLFEEVVTLSDPRHVRLVPGGLDMEMTAAGSPVPFTAEVSPRVRLERREEGGWVIRVQELPVTIGRLGTYDLASFIDPVDIETVTRHLLDLPGGTIEIDLTVSTINISADEVRIELQASFP